MFMLCLELKDQLGKLSNHACRSAMLHYHSPLLQKIKTWVFMPLFVLGMQEQKQTLGIEMFSNFVEDSSSPVTDVYVEIQSKVLEFYAVTLHITAHFTGLRYIMFNYPVLSATIGVGTNLMLILLICVMIWYHWNDTEWVEDAQGKLQKIRDEAKLRLGSSKMEESASILDDESLSILEYNESDNTLEKDDDFFLADKDSESSTAMRRRQLKKEVEE